MSKPGMPDLYSAPNTFFLYVNKRKKMTITIKKTDLQNNICHRVEPSKDLTINPPKLRLTAPKKTKSGPGRFFK